MAVLEVIKMGHPTLRKVSDPVASSSIALPKCQQTIDDLIDTMRSENGAGIAAPQVGLLQRIFIMEMIDNPRYPDKESFPLHVAINPNITPLTEDKVLGWEGCLSIPDIRGRLPRHSHVLLSALDRHGQSYETELEGFAAVVAQHELDHLNGILFIDQMTSMQSLSFYTEYIKYNESGNM